MSPFFLLALLAGLGSALGLLFLKRTLAEGAGYVRTLFCTNMAMPVPNRDRTRLHSRHID
jgi:hypothetical protein